MNTEQRDTQICPNCGFRQDNPPEPYCEDCAFPLQAMPQIPERNAAGIAYPSIQTQKAYWEQRDIGGNWTPDRIEANQDQYFS